MLMKMIADELLSDKTKDEIIDEINKAVDIPIISEKTEKAILEALWKIIKGVLLKRLGL
jgi:nucleoid DNA-binding protein|tara:strand:- start:11648 stop:11824 length:177 start_codon:yes stop_codon:yes gene_type:complete